MNLPSSRGPPGKIPDDLAHAFIIEYGRDAPRAGKYSDAISNHQGIGMVDFETVTMNQCDVERLKWLPVLECP